MSAVVCNRSSSCCRCNQSPWPVNAAAQHLWCAVSSGADNYLQNLIPLVLRPLRIVLSAERLRSLKIGFLKATHWPFVALILGYERWRLQLDGTGKDRSSRASIRGPLSPTTLRRPRQIQRPLLAVHSRSSPLADQARAGRSSTTTPLKAALETAELESVVSHLKAQLEELTTLITRQKIAGVEDGLAT